MSKPARQAVPVESVGVGIRYIESSALVAALLEQDAEALKALRARARRITSAVDACGNGARYRAGAYRRTTHT